MRVPESNALAVYRIKGRYDAFSRLNGTASAMSLPHLLTFPYRRAVFTAAFLARLRAHSYGASAPY